jgi:exonuclease SbcC
MLITRVELENIKNYESGQYEFGPGVTAISGPNGAGKTTVIEAIAWALFDQLPYKKEDFLRRGAKKGSVRVTFLSALDEREYTVYRDTGAGYYIYDPVTKIRLVEQKGQVALWIKQHLGVEPGADLKSLFVSTIGVPQGMLTVDFADQPAKRKVAFDKVLRVDEYHRSSEELRSLIRLIETRDGELREEIARVETESQALAGLLDERARLEKALIETSQKLDATKSERELCRVELDRLEGLRLLIDVLSKDRILIDSRIEEAETRRESAAAQVEQSQKATETVCATESGYRLFSETAEMLGMLEPRALKRDEIRKRLGEKEREQVRLEAESRHWAEKAEKLKSDRAEMERLAPLVDEQERAEKRRQELVAALGELKALKRREAQSKAELEKLRNEYADLTRQIADAEGVREMAEKAPALERERKKGEAELRETEVQLERLSERKRELNRSREVIGRLTAELRALDNELAGALKAEEMASGLSRLEQEDQKAVEEIATLRAGIEGEKKILSQIKGGLCPLLSERCLNLGEGQGLDQFLKVRVGNDAERLTEAERERRRVQGKLAQARAALKSASALPNLRTQRQRTGEDLELERANSARLVDEIEGAAVSEHAAAALKQRLAAIEKELDSARAAISKVEKLEFLRERLERLKEEGREKRIEGEDLAARLAEAQGLSGELSEIDERLRNLEDPRGRVKLISSALETENEVLASLQRSEELLKAVTVEIEGLTDELKDFAHLDEELASWRGKRAASERDYLLYLENAPVATMLDARKRELSLIDGQVASLRTELSDLKQKLEAATAEYDGEKHTGLRSRLDLLINEIAMLTTQLEISSRRLEEIESDIKRLLALQERLGRLVERRDRNQQLLALSDFMRDLLRKAGPYITEAHLQTISIEANQLFREVTGNPMVSLSWNSGYEIVLEEDGHERPFASLSGGEQMAAALAVRLALLKELSDMRIAFFDEPTTNMDEERRRNLAQQIGRIRDFDQLFIISHDDAFEGFTDQVVAVNLAGNKS